jgi:hypothetical protein
MLKMRLGAAPLIEVKMPHPAQLVVRSSQYGRIPKLKAALGTQVLLAGLALPPKPIVPFEPSITRENRASYRVDGKGRFIAVEQLSQWFPMSVVPGTTVPVVWTTV